MYIFFRVVTGNKVTFGFLVLPCYLVTSEKMHYHIDGLISAFSIKA